MIRVIRLIVPWCVDSVVGVLCIACSACSLFQRWFESVSMEHSDDHIDVTLVLSGPVFTDIYRTAFTEEPDRVQRNSDFTFHELHHVPLQCLGAMRNPG